MIEQIHRDRVAQALKRQNAQDAVVDLARALKAEGMTETDMRALFYEFLGKHIGDVDETKYDAVYEMLSLLEDECVKSFKDL